MSTIFTNRSHTVLSGNVLSLRKVSVYLHMVLCLAVINVRAVILCFW